MTPSRPQRAANSSATPEAPALAIRWLAEQCGLPDAPGPHLASQMIVREPQTAGAVAHIARWSRRADAESNFARTTREIPDGSDEQRVAALLARGYDGLLYLEGGVIVSHLFFQRHGEALHAFAAWTEDRLRASGLMMIAAMDFIAHARATRGVVRVRIGAGDNPLGQRMLAPVKPVAARLGWRLREGCWLDF
jgi:hypothetical protein